MTIQEQFMVTQTEVMRQLLQTQQQLAQQLQKNPRGENIDSQPRVTKYEHFYAMKPPTFERAKEPLAADAWIRAIEAKFSVFTLPSSEDARPTSLPPTPWCSVDVVGELQDHDSRGTSNHVG
jgi:hypothetical protein